MKCVLIPQMDPTVSVDRDAICEQTPESGRNPATKGSDVIKTIHSPITPLKFSLQLTPRR